MKIIPSIDLIAGKCVRLYRGDYDRVTEYSDNPLAVAKAFEEAGAEYLHLVDLDGALKGNVKNEELVRKIIGETKLRVELGGGIRSFEAAKKWLDLGVARVILGSVAVSRVEVLKSLVDVYGPEKIIAGIDALGGMVAISGWKEITDLRAADYSYTLQKFGVREIIYTDIAKDGALTGINLPEIKGMIDTGVQITASGGVTSLADLLALKEAGCVGAIIGKALYTGTIDLKEALAV
ncbi:MAG: 1-(5-phosphoribosyl)-5-[(5-phosphoribosylamino)methylideneamino]imidazole-4-carboxamide isomerase [Fusobacteriaceae bacterium]|jgi:phosphoribosylformimino-5-aminoimidazole carboxamide ribotide isomerase|nr:1-(5-phosphoribosyl)-5-[(5-phosphoribosylamino)methylideneamino]imidazole-4-carboxamide isomerase [Fusobacteriaceae bacterium]